MTLSKRCVFIFSQTLTRSRSGALHQAVEHFDHVDARAERASTPCAISRPMMPPPITSIALGDVRQFQRAGRIDHARVVRQERQLHRLRAGGDDRLLEADGPSSCRIGLASPLVSCTSR